MNLCDTCYYSCKGVTIALICAHYVESDYTHLYVDQIFWNTGKDSGGNYER